jgi:hypothetical protein
MYKRISDAVKVHLSSLTQEIADMKWTNEWLKDTQKPNREFIFLIEK